jgi:hypothetical protein
VSIYDVSDVLYDPDFYQDFTVYRKIGSWINGRFTEIDHQVLPFGGPVLPASSREIQQVPEGDRVVGMMAFRSDQEIFVTHTNDDQGNAGTSDEIVWRNDRYRVVSVNPWIDQDGVGHYTAFAVYM